MSNNDVAVEVVLYGITRSTRFIVVGVAITAMEHAVLFFRFDGFYSRNVICEAMNQRGAGPGHFYARLSYDLNRITYVVRTMKRGLTAN
jgi:hypothetical protein